MTQRADASSAPRRGAGRRVTWPTSTPSERAGAVAELGEPAYRAQPALAHYFVRRRPTRRDDRPPGGEPRRRSSTRCCRRCSRRSDEECDDGDDTQDALARCTTARSSSRSSCATRTGSPCASRPRPAAGWAARSARPARPGSPATCRPPRSSSRSRRGRGWPCATSPAAGCPTSSSWAWASRWRTTRPWSPQCAGSPTRRRTGSGISARSVTVSTVGLVPAIDQLAGEGLAVTLALSPARAGRRAARHAGAGQHALAGRRGARRRPALRRRTGRRVTIEYALISDINDHPRGPTAAEAAPALGPLAHVNLIPLNPTPGSNWTPARAGRA